MSFLLKEKNGAPADLPEQKSPDLYIDVIAGASDEDFSIAFEPIIDEFSAPTVITNAGDERLFIVEQPGVINIFYRDGSAEESPFLDIQDRVEDFGEQGLLGLAFPDDYCQDGRFYLNYTHYDDGELVTRISRFSVDENNPNQGDPDSEEILMEFDQDFPNHNGGHVEFGSDGYLYIATGDGGSDGDPNNRAQDITSYLGKLLRIDVSPETGYEIPEDNPYIFDDFGQDEIWAYGLRNPWKFAFDRLTGGLYIADVGQSDFEEVNYQPPASSGGLNYGWRCYEGTSEFNLSGCEGGDYVFPIQQYAHDEISPEHCSITGGRVYRGPSFESLNGSYFYNDLCTGFIWATRQSGQGFEDIELGISGVDAITTWGEDLWGEVYLANSGNVYILVDPEDELESPLTQSGSTLTASVDGAVAYVWSLNGEAISMTNEPEFEISETGLYEVEVSTENGCAVNLEIQVTSLTTGSYPIEKRSFKIQPNPAREFIQISGLDSKLAPFMLKMFSVDGRLVSSMNNIDQNRMIDVSHLPSGLYLIELNATNGQRLATQKMLID